MGYLYQDLDDDFGSQYPAGITFTNFEDTTARHLLNASLHFDLNARNLLDSPQTQTSGPQVERRILGSVTYSF